jgi:hypothetical protein
MSTWHSALEVPDGRLLMVLDCHTVEEPDTRCQVVATTWHGDRLMVAILRLNGTLRVVDAATLRFVDKQ